MTLTIDTTTEAAARAETCWRENRHALTTTQPDLLDRLNAISLDVEWIFGRDGALTALESTGAWYAGCSVPGALAIEMVKSVEITGGAGCYLWPAHGAELRAALDRIRPDQAIFAIVQDDRTLRMMLSCAPLSEAIHRNRLWFAVGPDWETDLQRLMDDRPGLCVPTQYIRVPILNDDDAQRLITGAGRVFSGVATRRSTRIAELTRSISSRTPRRDIQRLCVVAPSVFRLWDDAGSTLAGILDSAAAVQLIRHDPDNPAAASSVAFLDAIQDCDVVVSANIWRGSLPGLLPGNIRWATWVTNGVVPPARDSADGDVLILADERWRGRALAAGWTANRIASGAWPTRHPAATAGEYPAVIADTFNLDPDDDIREMSSHRLMWESIATELTERPFVLPLDGDIGAFLRSRMKRFGVEEVAFDWRKFIERLVLPAYQQGLVARLIKEGLPIRVFGQGWDTVKQTRSLHAGPVQSRESFDQIVSNASLLIHVWPESTAHPIDYLGKPILRRRGERFASDTPETEMPPLSANTILQLLSNT